jgi:hypothetical protein
LSTALSRLQQRLEQLRAAEEDARCRAAYEKAKAERDQLAAELAELYPAFTDNGLVEISKGSLITRAR